MKKIVALVLALALALSLCTVAFAATTTTTLTAKDYTFLDKDNNDAGKVETLTKTVQDPTSVTDKDGKTVVTYYADKYVVNGVSYFAVDSSVAYGYKLVSGGKVVAYLWRSDAEISSSKVVSAKTTTTKEQADATCGEPNVAKDTVLFTVDGKQYPAGDNWAVLNGAFVLVGDTKVATVDHTFTTKTSSVDGKTTSVKCDTCKKSFDVVEAGKVPAAYTGEVDAGSLTGYVILLGAAAADTSTTVDSSKTFDAGVAMYVGLSLMSVAGSAVVIGKKKEF